ncbi:interferon-induced very large GTPase 1-like isoform X2 [Xenia sp. Carnegie-2017]|uniref:interferon-induced very large GTPase 1-like isoform X2 n=1 Tax=Xenia sp. Carnegie-2017 TaxID=2897299 RepID=UPI001F048E88|nr:interferon-induced very large GTPase 1-like isoform X2 [Xenia sp. Carnegie-2017]
MEKQHYDKFTDDSVKEDDASGRQHGVNLDDDTEFRRVWKLVIRRERPDNLDERQTSEERSHTKIFQKNNFNLSSFERKSENVVSNVNKRNKNDERKRFQHVNGDKSVEKKKCSSKDGRESVKDERDSKQTTEENSLADIGIKEKNKKSKNVENVKDNIIQKEKENTSNNSVHFVKGHPDATVVSNVPEDSDLWEIAEKIYPQWLELARMLDIPEENLQKICSVNNKLPLEMLLKCKITERKNATANMLVKNLNAFGHRQDECERTHQGFPRQLEDKNKNTNMDSQTHTTEPENVTDTNEVFKEKFLNDDYNIRDEIVNTLQSFVRINGAVRISVPNQEIPYEHLFITVDKQEKMLEDNIKKRIDSKFGWKASRFIELRSSASKPLKLTYYGHLCLLNTFRDISCELTMLSSKDKNYFALTCAHIGCVSHRVEDQESDVSKIIDTVDARNNNNCNKYFCQPPNWEEEKQLGTFPCNTVSVFNDETDFMSIPVGKKEDFQRLGGDDMENLALRLKEMNKELYERLRNGQGFVEVRTSNHTKGFISERSYSYFGKTSKEPIFKNAVKVKSDGSFLKEGDSGSLVYLKDRENVWQPFAYAVCEINDDEDDDDHDDDDSDDYDDDDDDDDDIIGCKRTYICLKLYKALEIFDLRDGKFFIEPKNSNCGFPSEKNSLPGELTDEENCYEHHATRQLQTDSELESFRSNVQAFQMLLHWKKEKGKDATIKKLADALISIGRLDLLEKFLQVDKESNQTTEKNDLNDFDKEKKNEENVADNIVKEENVNTSKDRIDHVKGQENRKNVLLEKEKDIDGPKEFRQDFELGVTSNKTEKTSHKTKQKAISELCERLGLKTKLTSKHARSVGTFNDDKLTSPDQIPNYILKMLMMANHQALEFKLEPLKKSKVILKSNDGTHVSDSDDEDIDEIESDKVKSKSLEDEDDSEYSDSDKESKVVKGVNPMDALLGIFYCSDNFLRQILAVKLSACQLSVPFILPDPDDPVEKQTILLLALGKIIKSWRGASIKDSAKEVYATEHPFPIVSFIRVGNVTMSKSSLMNKIISDANGVHEFFFHKNIKGGDVKRKIVDGLVELVWYLPGRCEKNTLRTEICFANLRGDAQSFKKQVNIIREISNILCILLPSEIPDEQARNFLEEAILSKGKTLLIFNEKRQEEVNKYYKDLKKYHGTKLSFFTKALKPNKYEFFESIRQVIQKNTKDAEESKLKSLENLKCHSKESGVYIDEDPASIILEETVETWLFDGIQEAKKLFKLQGHVPILADLEKKIHNPKFRPTIKQEEVVNELYKELENVKKAQIESFNSMNKGVIKFLNSIPVMNEQELNRNLHHLKYLLDKASLLVMTDLHQKYRRALLSVKEPTKNTHNDNQDSQTEGEKNLNKLEELILKSSFGLEHIIREVAQLYQLPDIAVNDYAGAAAKILLSGEPLELLDGDSGYIPMKWFNAVYEELENQTNNASIYVISVLGIQSSGKSTMLNTMFGLEFPVSAGRCTRGSFACLVPLSDKLKCDTNFDYVLTIDTEGLKGMADPEVREHDNELATFAVGVADVTIVNIFGVNYNEMKEFLAMAVHAFLKMKLVKDKKSCKIVHQNVAADDAADKLMMDRRNLKQNLNHMARLAAIQENCEDQFQKLDDIMAFDENKDVFYIPSLLKGSPPMAPINPNYGRDLQEVKENIIQLMCSKEVVKLTVSSFRERVKGLWQAMLKEDFIFSFRNVIEIRAYASLDKKMFKESVILMVNGMAEIERSIERDLKICTTREERERCWMSSKKRIIAEAEELKTKMEKEMRTFFESSEDRSTLEQWKEDVMDKIKRYKRNQEASVIENCEATFHHLQQKQDVEEMKKNYEKQLVDRAKNLVPSQKTNDEEECKAAFQKEWKEWIGEVPLCEEVKRDVNEYMLNILLAENSDLNADMITKLKPKEYRISAFFNADPVIDRNVLSFNGGRGLKVVQNVYNWFIHDDVSRASNIKNKVISQGKQIVERVSNIAVRFTENDLITMYDEIISTIDKETEKQNVKFKKPLVCDILLYTFARAFPIFDKMEERYVEERDTRRNLESTLRPRLEKYFINLCKEMEKEVLAATSLVDVLREPIMSELNKGIVKAVVTKLSTKSMFLSKAHFHASVLIQLGENPSFELFIPYLKNPVQFLKNKLKEYVEDFCLNKESKLVRYLLKVEGEKLKSDIFSAIEVANKQARHEIEQGNEIWKVRNWIKKFVEQCSSLAITKEMFAVATLDEDLKETDIFDEKIRELVENFVQSLTDAELNSKTISNWQPAPHEMLSKLLLGCQAVCPFCKALCDQTMEQSNLSDDGEHVTEIHQQYSTKLHRPLGLAGHYNSETKILISDICTFLVAGDGTFQNIDTNWKPHPYKDYQSVNDYYKSWKIPPDLSFEASRYWQWFMVKFSKQLAKHYEAKEAKIPSSWKSVAFSEAVKQLKEEYDL